MSAKVEADIDGFLEKYRPELARQLREARSELRALFPRGFELVYDNYNALVFAISPITKPSGAFLSIAGYPRWVTLFFMNGATLDDPEGLLEGEGKQVRGIRLQAPTDLRKPQIRALIDQAMQPHAAEFFSAPVLTTAIRSVSVKQRPRQ
ncbi:MAG: DUF1801 domain-containing protein [Pseudomonadota bacterium]